MWCGVVKCGVVRVPNADDVSHLVHNHALKSTLRLHLSDVIRIELHLAGVADAGIVVPDTGGTGGAENTAGSVDRFEGRGDDERARSLVRGSPAGYVGDDSCPPTSIHTG